MSRTDIDWYVVREVPAHHLVCHRKVTQVNGHGDETGVRWEEIPGPVSIITEHQYVVNDDGTLGGLCDTRTRLVARAEWDVSGNGSEYGITPSVVDDDRTYRGYFFTTRGSVSGEELGGEPIRRSVERDRSAELRDLHAAHSRVMKMLAEITKLRDETIEIRDAAIRASRSTRLT